MLGRFRNRGPDIVPEYLWCRMHLVVLSLHSTWVHECALSQPFGGRIIRCQCPSAKIQAKGGNDDLDLTRKSQIEPFSPLLGKERGRSHNMTSAFSGRGRKRRVRTQLTFISPCQSVTTAVPTQHCHANEAFASPASLSCTLVRDRSYSPRLPSWASRVYVILFADDLPRLQPNQ